MQVNLYKKVGKYTDKDGKEKSFVNFYVKCGDKLIPVEVSYFPNKKCEDRDPNYSGRKEVLGAFAETLPDIEEEKEVPATDDVKNSAK